MNWADDLILAVLGLSVLIGLWRGLVSEVLAIVCWAAAFWLAWALGERVAAQFSAIEVPSVRLLVGYGLCFFAVLVLGALVSFLMRKLVKGSGLSGTDRMFGMVFGLVRGLLVVTVVVMLAGFTPLPHDPWWRQSQLMPTFQNGAEWLSQRLPESVSRHLDLRGALPALPLPPAAPPKAPPAPATKTPTT
jgi:membrane protein required for colicin V production